MALFGASDDDVQSAASSAAAAAAAAQRAADEAYFKQYASDLETQYTAKVNEAKGQLQIRADEINAQERNLIDNLAGFMNGAIAPMYKTPFADVTVRDPLAGKGLQNPAAPKQESPWPRYLAIAAVGFLVYRYFKKRRTA